MQRVYGELILDKTTSEEVVTTIKNHEIALNLNKVPKNFVLRKLGIKPSAACIVAINGRDFIIEKDDALEFGYDSIKVESIIFKTTDVHVVIRYMYFREDKVYQ